MFGGRGEQFVLSIISHVAHTTFFPPRGICSTYGVCFFLAVFRSRIVGRYCIAILGVKMSASVQYIYIALLSQKHMRREKQ